MFIAFINEYHKTGVVIARGKANEIQHARAVSGDLVFNDDGTICQNPFWLFNWERRDETCYSRKMQNMNLSVKDYYLN